MWKRKKASGSTRKLSPEALVATLGRRIAHLRRERRWARHHLARRLAISPKTVGNWEQGRSQPTFPLLVALAEHLEVSLDELARSEKTDEQET
jgi:transcriptional regulator with XRE-family HTH domain